MKSDWHFCNPGALSSHLPGDGPGALPLRYSYGETTSRLLSIKGIKCILTFSIRGFKYTHSRLNTKLDFWIVFGSFGGYEKFVFKSVSVKFAADLK